MQRCFCLFGLFNSHNQQAKPKYKKKFPSKTSQEKRKQKKKEEEDDVNRNGK